MISHITHQFPNLQHKNILNPLFDQYKDNRNYNLTESYNLTQLLTHTDPTNEVIDACIRLECHNLQHLQILF